MKDIVPPTVPQLVRFRKRLGRAMDHLGSASAEALDALRAFDGDALPLRFGAALAWEEAHSAEQAIPALKQLLAVALTHIDEAITGLRPGVGSAPTKGERP